MSASLSTVKSELAGRSCDGIYFVKFTVEVKHEKTALSTYPDRADETKEPDGHAPYGNSARHY
jgi:hypothetical protein